MPNIDEAIEALLAYRQADMEGIEVLTSRQAIHEVADELRRMRDAAQSVGMREALEPFAKLAALASPDHRDTRPIIYGFAPSLAERLTIGDLRRAAAAIAAQPQAKEIVTISPEGSQPPAAPVETELPILMDRDELIALLLDLASVNLSQEAAARQARRMADDLIARGLPLATKSAPVLTTSQNTAEKAPPVRPRGAGADTNSSAETVGQPMRAALEDIWALTASYSQYTLEHFARKVRSKVDAALAAETSGQEG